LSELSVPKPLAARGALKGKEVMASTEIASITSNRGVDDEH
jgi:hypothetical protein